MRSIDRRKLIAAILAVLVVSAAGVSASDHLAIGSQHTNESDFSNAKSLDNLTVTGSGSSASVELGISSEYFTDGFESEQTDTGIPDDWEQTDDSGATHNVTSDYASEGSQSYATEDQSSGFDIVRPAYQPTSGSTANISFDIRVSSTGTKREISGLDSNGNGSKIIVKNGDLYYNDASGDQLITDAVNTNEWISVEIYDIDPSADTFAVKWSSPSSTGSTTGLRMSGDLDSAGYTETRFVVYSNDGGPAYLDDFRVGEQPDSAKYIGPTHEVSNPEQAAINITQASNVSIDATVQTDGGTSVGSETLTSAANHTLSLSHSSSTEFETVLDVTVTGTNPQFELADESILFEDGDPQFDPESVSAANDSTVDETPVELSIDVSDADFGAVQGDSVDVTFYDAAGGSQIGTDTVTGNDTATTNWGTIEGGSNSWYAVATDSYGNEVTSQTFTFNAPSTLRLLNESDPDQLVTTNSEVEVTFFSGEQVITRTTTDGTVDLTGLPADETFTVQVEANGYVTRQAVIQGIVEQQNIYLLPESVESVATRFTIDDPTGQFATSNTRIAVKKPITKNGSTEYEIVASDIAGEGGYATILQQDQRYLLEVTNTETGNTRSLGPYVATEAQTVNLRIEALDFQFGSNEAGYQWDAAYENETGPAISFDWKTTTATAQTLDVTIRERGGDGTVIFDESYVEPEQVSELALIGDSVENPQATTWLVEWEATLADGNTVSGSAVAGPSKLPVEMPNVPDQVVSVLSILVILLVAGLFSAANVTVGAIVTSLTAGGLWFVGATPGAVTGGLVSLALFVAVIAHLRTNQQISPR